MLTKHLFGSEAKSFFSIEVTLDISATPQQASCLGVVDQLMMNSIFCVCFYLVTVWWFVLFVFCLDVLFS